jgi:hypothetical protein
VPEPVHLYQKKHEFKDKCPRCNASWYRRNDSIEEDSNKIGGKYGGGGTLLLQIKIINGLNREKFLPL